MHATVCVPKPMALVYEAAAAVLGARTSVSQHPDDRR
jgi:hypothetical protein